MKRWFSSPVHICLVGALVLSIGIFSVVDMAGSFLAGEENFDFGFLLILVGLGLLRGSTVQRGIAGALLALNLVVLSIFSVFYLIKGLFFGGDFEGINFIGATLVFAGIGYPFKVLFDARSDSWFSNEASGKAPPFVIPLTVVLTLFYSISGELRDYQQRKAMSEVFHFDLELKATDAGTGEVISLLGQRYGHRDFGNMALPDWMKGTRSSSHSFEGYAREPFELTVFAEGYDAQTIPVNRFTESVIEISLNPNQSKNK